MRSGIRRGGLLLGIVAGLAGSAILGAPEPEIQRNEASAEKALRACQEAASTYKKLALLDADANGVGEFPASLETMVDSNGNALVGLVTTEGIAHGYCFEVRSGGTTPESTVYATATPVKHGKTGSRTYVMANDGILWVSPSGAAVVTDYLPSDGGRGSPGGDFIQVGGAADRRKAPDEARAVKAIRACQESAAVYKKLVLQDADANGVGEYPASVEAMVDTNGNALIGLVTTKGIAHGYRFEVSSGGTTPENTCYATAVPVDARSGKRTFVMANDGICYASPSGAPPPVDYLPSDGGAGSPGGDFVVIEE